MQLGWLGLCVGMAQGCSLTLSEIDDYEQGAPDAGGPGSDGGVPGVPSCGDGRSFCLELIAFDSHVNERLEMTLAAAGVVRARAILEPFLFADPEANDGAGSTVIGLSNALLGTDEPHSVRFFADPDVAQDGVFTPPPPDDPGAPFPDHSWVIDVPDDGLLSFEHATNFVDLTKDPPRELEGDFNLTLSGLTPHPGQPLHVWVILLRDPQRTVGYYRLDEIPEQLCSPAEGASCTLEMQNPFTITIPGILDDGETYRVEILVDSENPGVFDPPPPETPNDHSWTIPTLEADRNGISAEFVHNSNFAGISPVPGL
jgi:hypothetical protein